MFPRISVSILFITCLFVAVPLTSAQLPLDGVVSYWSFDEGTIAGGTVEDVLGDNDGELDGNPKHVAGKVGKALEIQRREFRPHSGDCFIRIRWCRRDERCGLGEC